MHFIDAELSDQQQMNCVMGFDNRWFRRVVVHMSLSTLAKKLQKPKRTWNTFGWWLTYWRCVTCRELHCFCLFMYFHICDMLTIGWMCWFTLQRRKKSGEMFLLKSLQWLEVIDWECFDMSYVKMALIEMNQTSYNNGVRSHPFETTVKLWKRGYEKFRSALQYV